MSAPSFGEGLVQHTIWTPSLLTGVTHQPTKKFVIEGCVKRRLMTSLLRCRGVNLREERRGCGDPSRTYPLR
jgi:hypothetical protein